VQSPRQTGPVQVAEVPSVEHGTRSGAAAPQLLWPAGSGQQCPVAGRSVPCGSCGHCAGD